MIRGWRRSLLFSGICVGLIFLCIFFCIEYARAEAEVVVTPDPIKVEFEFNKPKGEVFTREEKITISNEGVTNISDAVDYRCGGITISSLPYEIPAGESVEITLKIEAKSAELDIEPDPFNINVAGRDVTVNVRINYHAKLAVSPPPSFGTKENMVSRTKETERTATIEEKYDYKAVDVRISPSSRNENNWVTASLHSHTVEKGSSVNITFHLNLKPGERPDHNHYRWTFDISSDAEIYQRTITIDAYISMPATLDVDKLTDKKLEIKFNKQKGTVSAYEGLIDIEVGNIGDEPMNYTWRLDLDLPAENYLRAYPSSGSGSIHKKSKNIKIPIIARYDTPERTYPGKLDVNAGTAGHKDVDITIVIIWLVDFTVSSTSSYFTPSPLSIDFGSLELKELGYERKRVNLTLTERYGYKPVRNLRLSKSGEYEEWLHDDKDLSEIPPGKSRSFTLKIEPGLEAVPKTYSWRYDISASEISRKRMEIKAKIVPMNIPEMIEYLNAFRESPLHDSYPSSESIISNGVEMLDVVERSEIGAEDWKKIPVLMKGTLSLLSSLNDGIAFSEEENYGKAVENLVSASVSASTIGSNSELNNWDISGYAKDISAGADKTTEEVLIDEAKKLENRGWEIKRAIDYATANIILFSIDVEFEEDLNKGVISEKLKSEFKNKEFPLSDNATVTKEEGEWKITDEKKFRIRKEDGKLNVYRDLKEWENVLESAFSYQYAATIYGLLKDKEKRIECNYEESRMMDKHEELVSDATHFRIEAEKNIMNAEENDLIRIWNTYLLLNPYNYDTFSESYGSAEKYLEDALKNYKVAGESLMSEDTEKKLNEVKRKRSYILSLFFLACILYGAAFFYTINRVIMGTMAYMRDMYEREVGDIIVK